MYKIVGRYKGRTETLDTARTHADAQYLRTEYQTAFGSVWSVSIREVPDDDRESTIEDDDPMPDVNPDA